MGNCYAPGCGCNSGGAGPPTSCTFTIVVQNACAGAGIAGATVVIKDGVGTTICSGTTDGTGTYTCSPAVPIPTPNVTVTNGGCSFAGGIGCNTPLVLYYCAFNTTVTVTGPAGTTLDQSGIIFGSPYSISSLVLGNVTPIGTVTSVSGTTWTFAYCSLAPFDPCFSIPSSVTFVAQFQPDWVPACVTFTPECGVDQSLSMSMFDWTTCYANYQNPAAIPGIDQGFCCQPPCVQVATGAGYYPLEIDLRWTSICNAFADDEGQWVTLSLVSDTVFFTGSTHVRILHWSTGCRGGQGNFISRPSGALNNVEGYDTCQDDFGSTSMDIIVTCGRGPANQNCSVIYNRYVSGDCTPTPACVTSCRHFPNEFCDLETFPIPALAPNAMCSPVLATVTQAPVVTCAYTIDIRETPCP